MHEEDVSDQQATLTWAETEAKAARLLYKASWGTFSIKVAQSSSLLAQIYAKMDR